MIAIGILQGPLADMDSALDNFPFLVWPQVVKVFSLAKLVDIFWIQRYQMKDMDLFQ